MNTEVSHDALHLYALAYCEDHEGVASYRALFAAMDAIHRSAPTAGELASSLTRLARAGLVRAAAGAVPAHVTVAGQELYERVNAKAGTVFDRLASLRAELALTEQTAPSAGVSSIDGGAPTVDPQEFVTGYRAYYGA